MPTSSAQSLLVEYSLADTMVGRQSYDPVNWSTIKWSTVDWSTVSRPTVNWPTVDRPTVDRPTVGNYNIVFLTFAIAKFSKFQVCPNKTEILQSTYESIESVSQQNKLELNKSKVLYQ